MSFFSFVRKNLNTPYRLVFLNKRTLVEDYKMSFQFWKWIVSLFFIFLLGGTAGYFIRQEMIPKHRIATDEINPETVYELRKEIDELNTQLAENDQYLTDVQKILNGETPERNEEIITISDSIENVEPDTASTVQQDQQHAHGNENDSHQKNSDASPLVQNTYKESSAYLFYFTPLRGVVTQEYLPLKNHPAIDVQAPIGEPIKSIADGVIIFSDWTSSTGYVVIIQHANNVISAYKHNSLVYKKLGEKVNVGEVIAAVGNTGELTSGPHLHFEIWVNGNPENPRKFISF